MHHRFHKIENTLNVYMYPWIIVHGHDDQGTCLLHIPILFGTPTVPEHTILTICENDNAVA